MKNWKRALVFGSLGASVFVLLMGRKTSAGVLAGVGLAALASEYPDKFQKIWERAPEYVGRGTQVMNMVSAFLDRLAEHRSLREGSESPYVV
jgi:hypothetical protein